MSLQRKPTKTPKKQPALRAYLVSLMSLALSCVMLAGTTFAWISIRVTSRWSEISAGSLSVDMQHDTSAGWVSLKEYPYHKVFGADSKVWKAGETDIQILRVVNEGDLPLSYQLSLAAENAAIQEDVLAEMASCFTVYTAPGQMSTFGGENWTECGTLDAFLSGELLYSGSLDDGESQILSVAITLAGNLDTAFMDNALNLGLKLVAYQSGLDAVVVTTGEELRQALQQGGDIMVIGDIAFTEPIQVNTSASITFDGGSLTFQNAQEQCAFLMGNGGALTLNAEGVLLSADNGLVQIPAGVSAAVTLNGGNYTTPGAMGDGFGLVRVSGAGDLTLSGITYTGESSGWAVRCEDTAGTVNMTVEDCTISAGHGIRSGSSGAVKILDSQIYAVQGLAVFARTRGGVEVKSCTIGSGYPDLVGQGLNPTQYTCVAATSSGGTMILSDCSITGAMNMNVLAVLSGGGNITASGCTLDEAAIYTHANGNGTITIS